MEAHINSTRCVTIVGPSQSGKSSLMESILHVCNETHQKTQVKNNSPSSDLLTDEKKTNINISNVEFMDEKYNFIDCPGSTEFINEFVQAARISDLAIIVIEPLKEKILSLVPYFYYLNKMNIPHILFVNKVDNFNFDIKELLGTRKVWEDKIGIDYDTALIRLMAYLPGQILPWHHDNLGNWCRNNKHINPDIDEQMCDLGPIRRYLVMVTDWHWGHVIQFQNSYYPRWKSGEVYNLPIPLPHCSANIGIRLKLTCSISGAVTSEIKS